MRLSSNLSGWKNSTEHNLLNENQGDIIFVDGAYKEKLHFLLIESEMFNVLSQYLYNDYFNYSRTCGV